MKRKIFNDSRYKVIDSETGEILTNGKCYISVKQLFDQEDDEIYNDSDFFQSDITFIKSFRGNGVELNNKLTDKEIAMLIFLSDFVCYEDCILRNGGNKKGNPLTVREMAEMRGIAYDTFRKTLSNLKKKGVIGYHTTGDKRNGSGITCYTMNPYIMCRGKKVQSWIVDFYKDTDWATMQRQKTNGASVSDETQSVLA